MGIKKLQIKNLVMGRDGVYVETFVWYEEKNSGKSAVGEWRGSQGMGLVTQ